MKEILDQLTFIQWFVLIEFMIGMFVFGFVAGNWWGDKLANWIIKIIKGGK